MNSKQLEALEFIVKMLDKNEVKYHLVGGAAVSLLGHNRKVNDIDINVNGADLEKCMIIFKEYIKKDKHLWVDSEWMIYEIILNYGNQEIEICDKKHKLWNDKFAEWVNMDYDLDDYFKVFIPGTKISARIMPLMLLLEYKLLLHGDHQYADRKFLEALLSRN